MILIELIKNDTNYIELPLEKSHGQRKLAGYSLCGHKVLDMTEQ